MIEREYKKRFSTNKFFDEDYEKTYMNYQKKLLQKKEGLQKLAKIKSQILNEFLSRKESKTMPIDMQISNLVKRSL